ncbi:MAG: hypothetical protein RQ754_16260 [Desulfuromonadales bacterium]|nr:hypothetical protein [Desulfuromonadales bacterium]
MPPGPFPVDCIGHRIVGLQWITMIGSGFRVVATRLDDAILVDHPNMARETVIGIMAHQARLYPLLQAGLRLVMPKDRDIITQALAGPWSRWWCQSEVAGVALMDGATNVVDVPGKFPTPFGGQPGMETALGVSFGPAGLLHH